jgi:putative endonuclease
MLYTGYSSDVAKRVDEHNAGLVSSTKLRTPFVLIYFEGCLNQQDATRREKYLKSGNGKIFLKSRLRNWFVSQNPTG